VTGRISKIGDASVRTALYEAANAILERPGERGVAEAGGISVAEQARSDQPVCHQPQPPNALKTRTPTSCPRARATPLAPIVRTDTTQRTRSTPRITCSVHVRRLHQPTRRRRIAHPPAATVARKENQLASHLIGRAPTSQLEPGVIRPLGGYCLKMGGQIGLLGRGLPLNRRIHALWPRSKAYSLAAPVTLRDPRRRSPTRALRPDRAHRANPHECLTGPGRGTPGARSTEARLRTANPYATQFDDAITKQSWSRNDA
jgi:hypothetical protein